MFILGFLLSSVIVWSLLMAFVTPLRQHSRPFTLLSLLFVLAGLALFTLFSWTLGLVRLGVPSGVSIPGDYLALGASGILVLLVGIAGVLSPVLAAWLVLRRSPKRIAA
jgi:hypothetical protein